MNKLKRFTFYIKLTYKRKLKAYEARKYNLKSPLAISRGLCVNGRVVFTTFGKLSNFYLIFKISMYIKITIKA